MSSTNEELPPPPKPRASPLDYRNTDLVSRLLAATPPYLYNMPLVPNSYFFSEMLRSFVQAKTENTSRTHPSLHHRRSRKRSWTQARTEYYQKEATHLEKPDLPTPNWNAKPLQEKCYESKRLDRPLELTKEKQHMNTNSNFGEIDIKGESLTCSNSLVGLRSESGSSFSLEKSEMPTTSTANHVPLMYPNVSQSINHESSPPNMILPPPPPIWYPPLYPTPYGIDPLHFFIDLRVSGHIYDRKNSKESSPINNISTPPNNQTCAMPATQTHNTNQEQVSNIDKIQNNEEIRDIFKQSRHSSAFSVPVPSISKNLPINLSSDRYSTHHKDNIRESKSLKFDVKSMGFDKSSNKTSINYIMGNIGNIYKQLNEFKIDTDDQKYEDRTQTPDETKASQEDVHKESEEEKEKRVKDLRALIGLELVVDYMNHSKPNQQAVTSEESSTDIESSGSPAVEVVAVNEELANDL